MATIFEMARALGEELQKTPQVEALVAAKGEAIRTNKLASDLYVAEQNFNNFVNSVFNIITATLTGEEPEQGGGCDPSCCSSCGGGCH